MEQGQHEVKLAVRASRQKRKGMASSQGLQKEPVLIFGLVSLFSNSGLEVSHHAYHRKLILVLIQGTSKTLQKDGINK